MGVFIVSVLVSVIPSLLLYFWLLKNRDNEEYKEVCKTCLVKGVLSVFLIVLVSLAFNVLGRVTNEFHLPPVLYQAYYTFIVLAFSEELVKYLTFKSILKKTDYKYDYFDAAVFMSIVGLGFGIIENITYSIGSGVIPMLIKGITLPHALYGFVLGYYYSKSMKTGNSSYRVIGFILAWLIHGLYDFGLSEELIAINDNLVFISLGITLFEIILLIVFIHFVRKEKKAIQLG
ncbi:MAG: PrsW family intramembrane metalloprotease [Solobacterium sp.]|nr:PrsW family intramembrane metalloprotease [Solobacterium sp.]